MDWLFGQTAGIWAVLVLMAGLVFPHAASAGRQGHACGRDRLEPALRCPEAQRGRLRP